MSLKSDQLEFGFSIVQPRKTDWKIVDVTHQNKSTLVPKIEDAWTHVTFTYAYTVFIIANICLNRYTNKNT